MYRVALTRISRNAKTRPIPVSTFEASTCPEDCSLREECYAKFGHLGLHWRHVVDGDRGLPWDDFLSEISSLPRHTLWRHNQAGDLPGDGRTIDAYALAGLVAANKGRRGFTYTHYSIENWNNLHAIEVANAEGFTVNISCDSLTISDRVSNRRPASRCVGFYREATQPLHPGWTQGGGVSSDLSHGHELCALWDLSERKL